MKRIMITLVSLLFAAGFVAEAQYLPSRMEAVRGSLVDENGTVLSANAVLAAIGQEIYDETYVGANKQYNVGRKLFTGGLIGVGAGVAVTVASAVVFANANLSYTTDSNGFRHYRNLDAAGTVGVLGMSAGVTAAALGFSAFSVGLVFKTIGGKRLQWVADDYNARTSPVTVRLGAGKYGSGLVVNF